MITNRHISTMTGFAVDLTTTAFEELDEGYRDLVAELRDNSELALLVARFGVEKVIAGNNPAITALQKRNKEFVTTAEQRAEWVMRELVAETYPSHAVVGEEFGAVAGNDWLWVFDPVDGTSAMIRTAIAHAYGVDLAAPTPSFGVTIAVVHGDQAVLGIVGELRRGQDGLIMPNVWVGVPDQPTTCNGVVVAPGPVDSLSAATLASTVPGVMFSTPDSWGGFQAVLDNTAAFVPDQNCIGFMGLLNGTVDIVMERDLTLPDASALVPILANAGVTVTDHDGAAVRFEPAARDDEYCLLAAAPALHPAALAAMRGGVPATANRWAQEMPIHQGYAKKFPANA